MDTPVDEQKGFEHVTSLISSSVDEVSSQGCLALDVIEQVTLSIFSFFLELLIFRGDYVIALMLLYLLFQTKVEVERLNALKARKMKELVFKRQNELEEIYKGVHMDLDSDAAREILGSLVDSGS